MIRGLQIRKLEEQLEGISPDQYDTGFNNITTAFSSIAGDISFIQDEMGFNIARQVYGDLFKGGMSWEEAQRLAIDVGKAGFESLHIANVDAPELGISKGDYFAVLPDGSSLGPIRLTDVPTTEETD